MSRFWGKVTLFLLPLVAMFGVPIVVLGVSGELRSIDSVVARQRQAEALLYGPAYSNPVKAFKLRAVQRRRPDVLALGSSRIMQVRAAFFRNPDTFYNAGGAVATLRDARRFLEQLSLDKRPRLVLLALDQWFFNPRWPEGRDLADQAFVVEDAALNIIQRSWRTVHQDIWSQKIQLSRLLRNSHAVGLNAVMRENGFRNDGSYFYGGECSRMQSPCGSWDPGFQDTLQRIERGERRFEWSSQIDPAAVTELDSLLALAAESGIHVAAFLPPLAPSVLLHMRASGQYNYVELILPTLAPLFIRRGFTVLDLTDASALGATDAEFIDGFHASERTYLRILLRLAAAAPVVATRLLSSDLPDKVVPDTLRDP